MKLNAVVRQHDADLVGDGCDQSLEEGGGRGSADRPRRRIQLAFNRLHFGEVDVEVADRIGLERLPGRVVALPPGATG